MLISISVRHPYLFFSIPLHSIHWVQSRHISLFCSHPTTSQSIQSHPATFHPFGQISPHPATSLSSGSNSTTFCYFTTIPEYPNPFNPILLHLTQSELSCDIALFSSHPATVHPIYSIQSCHASFDFNPIPLHSNPLNPIPPHPPFSFDPIPYVTSQSAQSHSATFRPIPDIKKN
jgi:hypothetical protein